MRRLAVVLAALVCLAATQADARHGGRGGGHRGGHGQRGGHGHHGHGHHGHGHHFRSHVFVGGFWDPFFYGSYYPYPVPYPVYGYPAYPVAPPEDLEAEYLDAEDAEAAAAEDPLRASYGLVQLRGVPEGAKIDLDGRYWLTAARMDERWLALPNGVHALVVRVPEAEPIERHVKVEAGRTHVVRFPPPRSAGR